MKSTLSKSGTEIDLTSIRYIATPSGKPKDVIISIRDWKKLVETLQIMSSKKLLNSINKAKRQLRTKTNLLSYNEVFNNL